MPSADDPRLPDHWVQVDPAALPEERRDIFLRRKRGIQLFFSGATEAAIKAACNFSRNQIYRLISERCLAQNEDGQLNGWRGALPHARMKAWARKTPPEVQADGSGSTGSLKWLFESPHGIELEQRFRKRILARPSGLEAGHRQGLDLFNWFIRELRALGYESRGEWPFNVDRMGYVSVIAFIRKVLNENPRRQRELAGGPDAQRKARAGDGTERPDLKVFERVECDAHKLDARMVVMVPSPHGGLEPRKIHRLWVIVLIDVATRAVLGYHLSLRRECSADDVLRACKRALTRWQPRQLQFSGNAYVPEAGMPSARHERYLRACWDQFSVDGALANTCHRVERQLSEVVGTTIIKPQDESTYASRRSKDDRPFIEAFFHQLAAAGFHRLATTTGSAPKNKQGRDPDDAAVGLQFQLEYAEELLDVLIANYNARPHSSLGYRSPLAQMDLLSARQDRPLRYADEDEVRGIVALRRLCTVLGGIDSGRRPYFNFANSRYSAEWLCLRSDLLGKNLWLQIDDEDDARMATVSTPQGLILGAVRAAPPWHRTPHTLYMRSAIRALQRRRLIHLSNHCDAVEELIRYCELQADKKLPPHPAYLEARRVLHQHVERLEDQALFMPRNAPVAADPMPLESAPTGTPTRSKADKSATASPVAAESTASPQGTKAKTKLPPMQMAKVW